MEASHNKLAIDGKSNVARNKTGPGITMRAATRITRSHRRW